MPPDPLESRGHWPLDYHSHLLFQSRLPTSKHFENPAYLLKEVVNYTLFMAKTAENLTLWGCTYL